MQLPHNNDSYTTHDPSAYTDGPVAVSHGGYVTTSSIGFIEACGAVAIPIVDDLNAGNGVGVTQGKGTIDERVQRSSSYSAYYKPVKTRPNLVVKSGSSVQKVLLENSGSNIVATGAIYIDEVSGKTLNVSVTKEVIMSAGTFQTPQLLMLSAIGPEEMLNKTGIEPIVVNENVGQHMQDQPIFTISVAAPDGVSNNNVYYNTYNLQQAEQEYFVNRSGRLTNPTGDTNAFQELSDAELQALNLTVLADAGIVDQSHIEYVYTALFYPAQPSAWYTPSPNKDYISIGASIMSGTSRGSVGLQSSNAGDAPVVHLNVSFSDSTSCPRLTFSSIIIQLRTPL